METTQRPNPTGRQNKAPTAVAAPAIISWLWPWSRLVEIKRKAGVARIRPIAQEIEIHSKGEIFESPMEIERRVSRAYL
ncbi:hypothetical protein COLO4_16885 [Corchorus olitorius]|uniref:Uncharacterized protein n=1 Tax=Corchorus olitorius TaxID=93759 RepID=A0A1R3JF61_9ROSI|nr:hypothetical protein COLO4_16885 [Corchorus olitorius]